MNEEVGSAEASQLARQLEAVKSLIRGESFDAATTLARELIEDYPDNAEAYTALGDAYAGRRMWPEAVEWYHEAVARGDNSAQEKLAQAREQLSAQVQHPGQPSASELEQQRTRLRVMLASAGALIVIAGLIAALTLFPSSPPLPPSAGDESGAPTPGSLGTSAEYAPGRRAAPGAGLMPPPPRDDEVGGGLRPPTLGSGPKRPAVPTIVVNPGPRSPEADAASEAVPPGPRSDRDLVLERAIGSLSWPDGTAMRSAVAVAMDPYMGYVMITFEIPRRLDTRNIYGTVVRQSYSIAAAAVNTDPGVKFVTLRGLLDLDGSSEGRTVVAYRGNTSRESLEYWVSRNRTPSQQQLWSKVFATTWWNPGVSRGRIH